MILSFSPVKKIKFKKFALYYFWSFLLYIFELSKFSRWKGMYSSKTSPNMNLYLLLVFENEQKLSFTVSKNNRRFEFNYSRDCGFNWFRWADSVWPDSINWRVLSGFSWFRSADPVEIPQSCIRSAASARLSPLKLDPHSTLFWIRSKLHPLSTNCIRSRLPRIRSRQQTGSASPVLKTKQIP